MEFLYLPLSQNFRTQMTLLIATSGASDDLAQPIRRLVKSIDSNQPVIGLSTIEEYFRERATKVMNTRPGWWAAWDCWAWRWRCRESMA